MIRSIKQKIIITLFLITSVTFGLLNFYTSKRLNDVPPIILQQYQDLADARANEFSNELKGLQLQIEMISISNIVQTMDMTKIKPYLMSLAKQGRFTNLTISDIHGVAWRSFDEYIDISNQQQFQDIIINHKNSSLSHPFVSPYVPEEYPLITIAYAIKENNNTVGLINGVITTEFINRIVDDITFKKEGYGWVVDELGQVVAYPNDHVTIKDSLTSLTGITDLSFMTSDNGTFTFNDKNNHQMLGIFSTINNTNGWKLILTIDAHHAYQEVFDVINAIKIALVVAGIVLILFAIYNSRRLTTPIVKLKNVFEAATGGNFNVRADESLNNELGDAAKSFNTMLDQIKQLTFFDPITGLNNYISFMNEAVQLQANCINHNQTCYIAIVSIVNFKKINTFYGYDLGNDILRELSQKIVSVLDEGEIVARYFSDEMVLGLYCTGKDDIHSKIQRIINACESTMTIANVQLQLDINCGISTLTVEKSLEDALREATLANHKSKTLVVGNTTFYDQAIYEEIQEKQALETALALAIDNNELFLLYQPIYDSLQQRVVGYEALLRWNHPDYQLIPISTIIEIAETNGLITQIGEWVFKNAVFKLNELHQKDNSLFMSINVSPLQLISDGFLTMLEDTLKTASVPPAKIVIEITERLTMLDVSDKKVILTSIKKMGVHISVDDFGTGYSSLSYISQLPIDTIKIDRQFIQQIAVDDYSRTLVTAIISIAKTLNLSVIGEGVETDVQLKILQELGCSIIQGYIISKPISLDKD